MNDDEDARKWFDDTRGAARKAASRLADFIREEVKGFAADMGEPYTKNNAMYFSILYNIVSSADEQLNGHSPEIRALHELAGTVTPRQRDQWLEASRIVERLFDDDGGAELGLGELLGHEFNTPEDRIEAMRKAAAFHRVPSSYAPALGDVVIGIMMATPEQWREGFERPLPQPWASNYAYAVGALCARAVHRSGHMS